MTTIAPERTNHREKTVPSPKKLTEKRKKAKEGKEAKEEKKAVLKEPIPCWTHLFQNTEDF